MKNRKINDISDPCLYDEPDVNINNVDKFHGISLYNNKVKTGDYLICVLVAKEESKNKLILQVHRLSHWELPKFREEYKISPFGTYYIKRSYNGDKL
jgi:hypothetical protein